MNIKLKKRECKDCKKEDYIFSKGRCKPCSNIEYARKTKENRGTKKGTTRKNGNYKIPRFSKSKLRDLVIYRPIRDKFLKENPICQVRGCNNDTTNNHHRKGRIGDLLYNVKWFMACCSTCHPQKIHFTQVKWAKEMGYILNKSIKS